MVSVWFHIFFPFLTNLIKSEFSVSAWWFSGLRLEIRTCNGTHLSCTRLSNKRTWWCHQMETFSALLALCAGNSPVTGGFPAQRLVTLSFDVFFDLCLNKRWVNNPEAGVRLPSCSLWCHCNKLPPNYNSQGMFIVEFCNFLVFYFWALIQYIDVILPV